MKEQALFIIFLFAFTAFLFPTWYSGALNANITDSNLQNFIAWLPVIIMVIVSVVPIYNVIEENRS